ncbi:MAG: hypothetical protein LW626_13960 [Verrucomicrobium sp.]|nr:hypothetical protein [Verrucomicrobium sp.]
MGQRVATGGEPMAGHHRKQFAAGPGHRIGRELRYQLGQHVGLGQLAAILLDEAPQRLAVTQPLQRTGQQGQMDVPARLIPGAEGARRHVLLHPLGRPAEPGVLPVVDRAGAIGRQVLDEAGLHQARQQRHRPVADQVRAIHQDDRRACLAGGPHRLGDLGHPIGLGR